MLVARIPPRPTLAHAARTVAGWLSAAGAALVVLVLVACGDSAGPAGGGGSATLSGTVRAVVVAGVVEGATVTVGTRQATSDASGYFELAGLPVGSATVMVQRRGYLPAEATIAINAGTNTHDFSLTEQEIYTAGPVAVYAPAGAGPLRGTIIILGGPNTSGFVTGGPITSNSPELEQSLQSLGVSLRALAAAARVALLGSATIAMQNQASSDDVLFAALRQAGGASEHAEIETAPVLMFGLSAGAPEASGLVSRHPDRAIGLLVRVPTSVTSLTSPAALAVPTFVMQADSDFTNNFVVQPTFAENRSRGGLWSLAVEPGVGHHEASSLGNSAATGWISAALNLRLPAAPGAPLVALAETSGWLGDQRTLAIAPWASFTGDPGLASWLLSSSVASAWKTLGTDRGGTP